jgi:aspartate oxidase
MAWKNIGIVRQRSELSNFMKWLSAYDTLKIVPNKDDMERQNMVLVAREITAAAMHRPLSIGAHFMKGTDE